MNFQSYFAQHRIPNFVYKKNIFKWIRKETVEPNLNVALPIKDLSEIHFHLKMGGKASILNLHVMNEVYSNGPKVFQMSNLDFEILENIDLNMGIEDYSQPYKAVVIDLPENYIEKKRVPDSLVGEYTPITGVLHEKTLTPQFVMIVHDRLVNTIFVNIFLSSYDVYSAMFSTLNETIEEHLKRDSFAGEFEKSLKIDDKEKVEMCKVIRAALNACLYIDDNGFKQKAEDKQKKRLQHYVDVAKKSKDQNKICQALRELNSYPEMFELKQEIKLKTESGGLTLANNGNSWIVKPHWRRGHYRMQACGPKLSERKRIRIDPVLVNGELFKGKVADTSVTYLD